MNSEKHKPLIWDFAKLLVAILLVAAAILCMALRVSRYKHVYFHGGSFTVEICIFMTLLTPFLAGFWGHQAIRKSDGETTNNKKLRICLSIYKTIGIYLLFAMLFVGVLRIFHIHFANLFFANLFKILIIMLVSPWTGSLLFLLMLITSIVAAFTIGKRFWLYLLTFSCLLAAHILFFHLAFEIALTV